MRDAKCEYLDCSATRTWSVHSPLAGEVFHCDFHATQAVLTGLSDTMKRIPAGIDTTKKVFQFYVEGQCLVSAENDEDAREILYADLSEVFLDFDVTLT